MIPQTVKFLVEAGCASPSADNTQPWQFEWTGEELRLIYRPHGGSGNIFATDGHCADMTMGAVIENLMQAAMAANLVVNWRLNARSDVYLSGQVPLDHPVPAAARDHPLFKRHTNRFDFLDAAVPQDILDSLARMREGSCTLLIAQESSAKTSLAGLVELASSVRFQLEDVHRWFSSVLRFSADARASGTGLDVESLGLPPGGTVLLSLIRDWNRLAVLNKFGMYRLLAKVEAAKIRQAPLIIGIVGVKSKADNIAAGRLMERVWISMTTSELAVQPFYVVSDVLDRTARNGLPDDLVDCGRQLTTGVARIIPEYTYLHMLLRVGWPARRAPRSDRREMDEVLVDALGS